VRELAELEKNLAALYTIFDNKFPSTKIWPFMISEELKHEEWLRQIIPKVENGTIYFFKIGIALSTISSLIESIQNECKNAERLGIEHEHAVSLALKYEDLALKKNIFESFDSQNPDLMNVIDSLHEDIKKHIEMLEDTQLRLQKKLKV